MLKVVSWNVNSVTARLERLLAFLKREAPDIICLQELKCLDEKFPEEVMKSLGYESVVFGQKTYNGVAILSKGIPLKVIERSFMDKDPDTASRCIAATAGDLRVINVYVPNGQEVGSEKFAYKLMWLDRFKKYLTNIKDKNTLIVGDFNIAPEDLDVHDPDLWSTSVLCHQEVRDRFSDILGLGYKDLYRSCYPQGREYTWWDYRHLSFPKNNGLRIDLLLGTGSVLERTEKVSVFRAERKGEKPSDHAPVMGVFRF